MTTILPDPYGVLSATRDRLAVLGLPNDDQALVVALARLMAHVADEVGSGAMDEALADE